MSSGDPLSDLILAAPVPRRSQRAASKEASSLIYSLAFPPDQEDEGEQFDQGPGPNRDKPINNQPTIASHLRRMSRRVQRQKINRSADQRTRHKLQLRSQEKKRKQPSGEVGDGDLGKMSANVI